MKPNLIILDRDGTICEEMPQNENPREGEPRGQYLLRPDQLKLLPGVAEFIRLAKDWGSIVVVATNQPQVGKGLLTEAGLNEIHALMEKELGGLIDRTYFCPHVDNDKCACRKPKPGMLLQAMRDFGVTAEEVVMIGDSDRDVIAGQAAGCLTVFVRGLHNDQYLERCTPNRVIHRLPELIPWLFAK